MPYIFHPYDVLQIEVPDSDTQVGKWQDFSTLRTEDEAAQAVRLVQRGQWQGRPARFCISQFAPGYGLKPVFTAEGL